jgi:hypothetical protein
MELTVDIYWANAETKKTEKVSQVVLTDRDLEELALKKANEGTGRWSNIYAESANITDLKL